MWESIQTRNPAFLFNVPGSLISVIFLLLPYSNTVAHIQFCYRFKAQREVTEGACQSDKLSPKWWQIGCLAARLPIKSRPGLLARTRVVWNGDRWLSGEAELGRWSQHSVTAVWTCGPLGENWIYVGFSVPWWPKCNYICPFIQNTHWALFSFIFFFFFFYEKIVMFDNGEQLLLGISRPSIFWSTAQTLSDRERAFTCFWSRLSNGLVSRETNIM